MADNKDKREIFNGPDDTRKSVSNNADKIKAEIENLAKKGRLSPSDITELYNKFGDNETIVDEILRVLAKKYKKIKKRAHKVAEKIERKYKDGNRPLHEILDIMMKYKTRQKWSDFEYDEFRKELIGLLTGARALEVDNNQNILTHRSRINRALGNTTFTIGEGLKIKESEHGVLSEILSMYEKSSTRFKSNFMLSLMYTDCSLVAMTGEYKRERHIASNYIHPLIACMFLPKFDIFEIHMLYSNFGNIVKSRRENKPIVTEPDSLLFYDITSDPNDIVCEVNSPISDLRNRYKVQIGLWRTVTNLRNGNYYEDDPINEFISTLNTCRNNLYDNADLAYNQDEGAIMRRLLSVFSLRPTIIYTKPVYSIASFAAGPFGFNASMGIKDNFGSDAGTSFGTVFPFNNQPVYTITSIPMINIQIPPFSENAEAKELRTSQTIWINENKTMIPKEQSIIYSKEVLIFYVNRRIQRIQIRTFSNPLTFSQLPLTMSSFERLNAYPINVADRMALGRSEEIYHLRSVVAVTETLISQGDKSNNIITGCTGLVMTHRNFEQTIFEPRYYLYDPFGASFPVRHPNQDGYFTNKPISMIPAHFAPPSSDGIENPSFFDRASRNGTIFIYAKPSGYDPHEVVSV